MGGVRMRSLAAAALGACLLIIAAVAFGDQARQTVILGGTSPQVLYHAESAPTRPDGASRIIGGNIHIVSDRAPDDGQALAACDPDPRTGTHPRPDDEGCTWDAPQGSGEDFIAWGRHIQENFPEESGQPARDTDFFPNGTPVGDPGATPTRESFNGRGGFDRDNALFMDDRLVLEDEDLNFRIRGVSTAAYLAPQGDANNRWRRLCGTGVVEAIDDNRPPLNGFAVGQPREFVVQIWDADWRDPSDQDGGNQDYFIIDVFSLTNDFDPASCRSLPPGQELPPTLRPPSQEIPPPGQPGQPAVTPEGEPLVLGEQIVAGTARLSGPRRCVNRTFSAVVRGRQIARVVFLVDGRRIGTVQRPNRRGEWAIRINPRRFSAGVHRIRARVSFVRGAGRSVSRSVAFQRCPRPAQRVAPRFTG